MPYINMWLTFVVTLAILIASVGSDPTGCTYDAANLLFTCNARSWSLPLTLSQFTSATPQRLKLTEFNGEIYSGAPGPVFSGFSSINTASFNGDYDPYLHIQCTAAGSVIMTSASFTDMGYIYELKFIDCNILSIPDSAFQELGTLNYLGFEGGYIQVMIGNSFSGLNITRMSAAVEPKGELSFKNARIVSAGLPVGVLFSLTDLETLIIENANLRVFSTDMMYALAKLKTASFSYNPFTYIPEDLFKDLYSLTRVEMYGIDWGCSCNNLWFIDYLKNNNITMKGDVVCADPSAYINVRGTSYNTEQCVTVDPCNGQAGLAMGTSCLTVLSLVCYGLILVVTVLAVVGFGLAVHTKRQIGPQAPKKPPPARRRSANFNKVDDLKSQKSFTEEPAKNKAITTVDSWA